MSQEHILKKPLQQSALLHFHNSLGAKMVPFGGFFMPLSYPSGILAEHNHCRSEAALFDVSHMNQFILSSNRGLNHVAEALEKLVPGNILGLTDGQLCYTMFTNINGGIIDDLIVARAPDHFLVVGNGSNRDVDMQTLCEGLPGSVSVTQKERALIALQGPKAQDVLSHHTAGAIGLSFMTGTCAEISGQPCWMSRSGYTGEDGYEIASTPDAIENIVQAIYSDDRVKMAGLGARDTLRLEAGLNLYGQDLNHKTTPIEAGLSWTINSRRRLTANFPGAEVILAQLQDPPQRTRIAVTLATKSIARTGSPIKTQTGQECGQVTSGGFSPTTNRSIATGYIERECFPTTTKLNVVIRGNNIDAREVALPFVPHRYRRK
jgi:aminomethyltransferase